MNTFSSLNPEINDEEIDGEKKYRNVKKKIRRLKEKDLLTPEQEKKLRILGILVQEYESRHEGIPEKKAKQKKQPKNKSTNKEEEDLLNKEYEKNKDYWKKKGKEERERKLKEEWEKEQKNKERDQRWREQQKQHHQHQHHQHHQNQQRQKQQQNNNYNTYRKKSPEEKFCENYDTEVPQDIINLYRNYSTQKYRELALKYHPDKGNNNIEYQKMINNIKDIFK